MKKTNKSFWCLALSGVMLLSGCEKKANSDLSEISVSSVPETTSITAFPALSCGVRIEKAPDKIVSLSPAVTEIICEMGFKDKLVGISNYCDYPNGLNAEKVGSTENPDIDAMLKLKPDIVFTLSELSEREAYTLKQADITVLTAEPPKNMEGFSALYREIAAAFYGRETTESEKETEKAVQIGSDARLALENAAKNVKLDSFIYVTEKLTIAGTDTFESAVLCLSGTNICDEKGYVSADKLKSAPKYIVADNTLSEDDLAKDETLNGFINGGAEVRFVNAAAFERPTARTADVFKELSNNTETVSSNEQSSY